MRRSILLLILIFAASIQAVAAAPITSTPDAWDRVLAAVGLTKETCRFDFSDMENYGGQEFLLPFFDATHREPFRIPLYARVLKQGALEDAASAGELVMLAGWRMQEGTRRTLIGDPLEDDAKASKEPSALAVAIRAFHVAVDKPLTPALAAKLDAAVKTVPADVARNAALLLRLELKAIRWRNRALAKFKGRDLQKIFNELVKTDPGDREEWDDEIDDLMHAVDLKYLLAGGTDLALAVDKAAADLAKASRSHRFTFDWDTWFGRIALHGAQDDVYPGDRPYLLILDTGGNETYAGGGATYNAANPASVLLDLAGNDFYLERPTLKNIPIAQFAERKKGSVHPTFGAGVLGYGILMDADGDDQYRSLNTTQGRGMFGMGVLHDRAGNDRYDAYTGGQGAATFGVGVLADLSGADQYRCFTTAQGFGSTKGCGLLVDAGIGDDLYEANDTVLDFPSAQTKDHNSSLVQGAGFGRRADYSDGHSLAGGIGALVDGGGKNSFSSGVYGQGVGYWYGLGLLCAGSGQDTYQSIWYGQGASAHFAVGVLWDEGGDDNYTAGWDMAQGAGHDFSTGFLMDDAGNDRYQAPNLSLGGGNANGFGFFWDKAGNDTYAVAPSITLGSAAMDGNVANTIRERNLTLGFFLDGGGTDVYPTAIAHARNNALWAMPSPRDAPLSNARGAGLDVE